MRPALYTTRMHGNLRSDVHRSRRAGAGGETSGICAALNLPLDFSLIDLCMDVYVARRLDVYDQVLKSTCDNFCSDKCILVNSS